MKEEKELFTESNSGLTIKEQVARYLAFYPLFIISVIVCVGGGIMYLRYAVPMYKASALVFVKNDKTGNTSTDLIKTAITGDPMKSNLDNEIQLMSSASLMGRVVNKNGFNISYFYVGKIRNTDLYLDAPFRLIPQALEDSNVSIKLTLLNLTNDGGMI